MKKSALVAVAVSFMLLFVPLRAGAADEKGWYPTIQNNGWYSYEKGPHASGWVEESKNTSAQTTTQPATNQSQFGVNSTTQPAQGTAGRSSGY